MGAVVGPDDVERALTVVHERSLGAWVMGEVVAGAGDATLVDP
jgi:hypothetical protein